MITGRARLLLKWEADQRVALDGFYNVYISQPDGADVNYSAPLNGQPILAWPAANRANKIIYDGEGNYVSGGFGDGLGPDGYGMDGYGCGLLEWITPPLSDGHYKIAICPGDAAGNVFTASAKVVEIDIAARPAAPRNVIITEFDPATGNATVTWE